MATSLKSSLQMNFFFYREMRCTICMMSATGRAAKPALARTRAKLKIANSKQAGRSSGASCCFAAKSGLYFHQCFHMLLSPFAYKVGTFTEQLLPARWGILRNNSFLQGGDFYVTSPILQTGRASFVTGDAAPPGFMVNARGVR